MATCPQRPSPQAGGHRRPAVSTPQDPGVARGRGEAHGGEGKESCASCPGETIGPSNLQWRLESSRSSVSSRVCQVRVGDHEGEIRDQVTLGLMNFQSVPGLGQGLIWPRLHPGWVSAAHSVPPSDTPCGSFHPQPQPGASLQTHLEGLWVTPPSLGALCTPRRTSPDRLSSQLPCHGFSLRWLPVLAPLSP